MMFRLKGEGAMRGLFLVVLVVSLWTASACPAEDTPPVTGAAELEASCCPEHKKLNTPDADTIEAGCFEIESSYTFTEIRRFWDSSGHEHTQPMARDSAAALSVGAGIAENLDLHLTSSYQWVKDESTRFDDEGPDDLIVSLRYRFVNDVESHLFIAYIGGVTAPLGSPALEKELELISTSQEFWSVNNTLVLNKDWGRWTTGADIGYSQAFGAHRENVIGVLNGDAALGYYVFPWLQPEIELNYAHEFTEHISDEDLIAATVGVVIPLKDCVQLLAGVQEGLWGRNTEEATTYRIQVEWTF